MEIFSAYFGYIILRFRRELWLGYLDNRIFSKQVDVEVMEVNEIVKMRGEDGSRVLCSYSWALKGI